MNWFKEAAGGQECEVESIIVRGWEVVDVVHSFTDTMLADRPRWREVTSEGLEQEIGLI